MIRLLVAIALIGICGCGSRQPTMKLTDVSQAQAEIARVASTLEPAKAAEFTTAAEVLGIHAAKSATSEAAQKLAPVTALNGKTPDAIIAEYNKLDPAFRRQAGTAIAEARSLKEVNDYNERWLRRNAELEAMLDKHEGLGGAMGVVGSLARDKEVLEGKLAAAKWQAEEFDKTPQQLIEMYGGGKGADLIIESDKAVEAFRKK